MSKLTAQLACLASHPTLPAAAMPALLNAAAHPSVRRSIAGHPNLPQRLREQLVSDRFLPVRRAAVAALTDPDQLTELARTGGTAVRTGVAANRHTPPDVLDGLLDQPTRRSGAAHVVEAYTRAAMMNPAARTTSVISRLRQLKVAEVVGRGNDQDRAFAAGSVLAAHPQAAQVWAACDNSVVARAIAQQPTLQPEIAAALAARGRAPVALGGNPFVPREILTGRALAVRDRLIAHAANHIEVTNNLARDLAALAKNRDTQVLAADLNSPTLDLLIADAGMTADALRLLVTRRMPMVESTVLGKALTGQGRDMVFIAADRCSVTRLAPVAEAVPLMETFLVHPLRQHMSSISDQASEVSAALGDDPDAWAVFMRLLASTSASIDDLLLLTRGTLMPVPA